MSLVQIKVMASVVTVSLPIADTVTLTAWRVYVMVCTFPCLSAAVLLFFMPESPSFLFAKGKVRKAIKVLEKIQKINRLDEHKIDNVQLLTKH